MVAPAAEYRWEEFPLPCPATRAALFVASDDRRAGIALLCGLDLYVVRGGDARRIWEAPPGARVLGAAPLDDPFLDSILVGAGSEIHVLSAFTDSGCKHRSIPGTATVLVGAGDVDGDAQVDAVLGAPDGQVLVLTRNKLVPSGLAAAAWVLARVGDDMQVIGFDSDKTTAVRVDRSGAPTRKEMDPLEVDPTWVYPVGTSVDDGVIVASGGQVVGAHLGDPQLRLFDTCAPADPPTRLSTAEAVIACPGYVAVLSPAALSKIPVPPQRAVRQVLAGDLDGNGSADLLLIAADGGALLGSAAERVPLS